MGNRANRSAKLFRKAIEKHTEGFSANDARTEGLKKGNEKMRAAVRELKRENELCGRVEAIKGCNREPELMPEKMDFGCRTRTLKIR